MSPTGGDSSEKNLEFSFQLALDKETRPWTWSCLRLFGRFRSPERSEAGSRRFLGLTAPLGDALTHTAKEICTALPGFRRRDSLGIRSTVSAPKEDAGIP